MLQFAQIYILQFLWVLLVCGIVLFLVNLNHQKKIHKIFPPKIYNQLASQISFGRRRMKRFLIWSFLVLAIFSLARPQFGESKTEIKSLGVEIMMLVDVSESMMAEDLKPSRLEQAKKELSRLVDKLGGSKIGIIAFAGSSSLLCPLTTDMGAIKMYLESLSPNSVSSQGTNFQEAFDLASEAYEKGGVSQDSQSKVTRVILVASDGEDQEIGALDSLHKLTEKGIRIFSLALGTEKGGTIPVRDNMGYLVGFKKGKDGQTILTTVKGEFLKRIAQEGKGSFYFAQLGGDYLNKLLEDFSELEQSEFESHLSVQYEDKFQIFLLIGILFLLLELFLSDRHSQSTHWQGRLPTLGSLLLLFIISGCGPSSRLSAIYQNNLGRENLLAELPGAATEDFSKALGKDPYNWAIHNNLGISFEMAKDLERAISSYKLVDEKSSLPELKFIARFNVAQALARQKKIPEAIDWYQKALEINPASKEVKTNIELLRRDQQSGKGEGEGESNQNQNSESKDDKSEGKDNKEKKDKESKQDKKYKTNQKYEPRPFKGELSEGDVKKILGELKQQEQKIRAEYNKKESKEQPNEKDW